jgi:hypothetical protein
MASATIPEEETVKDDNNKNSKKTASAKILNGFGFKQ